MSWVTLSNGNLCMDNEFDFFNKTRLKNEVIVQKDYKQGMSFKFSTFAGQAYCISHGGLTFWFKNYQSRIDVYDFLRTHKPVPTWEEFIGFLKEC